MAMIIAAIRPPVTGSGMVRFCNNFNRLVKDIPMNKKITPIVTE